MKPFNEIIEDHTVRNYSLQIQVSVNLFLRIISYKFVIVFFIWNGLEENLGNQ